MISKEFTVSKGDNYFQAFYAYNTYSTLIFINISANENIPYIPANQNRPMI